MSGSIGEPIASAYGPAKRNRHVELLRDYLATRSLRKDDRLPPERQLCLDLSISRGSLRHALAVLEASGEVWRHVGKGTFAGKSGTVASHEWVDVSNPMEVTEARLYIEPKLASLAAIRGTGKEFQLMRRLTEQGGAASDVRRSQELNDQLHRVIAAAARNPLLIAAFEMIYQARAQTNWGKLRPLHTALSELQVHWSEHGQIVEAICSRDAPEAEELMAVHITHVQDEIDAKSRALGRLPRRAA
jgi:DNA-binding FadR family transcriptional regulator